MNAQISAIEKEKTRFGRVVEALFNLFLRLMAAVFFGFSIQTWLSAVGYWDGAQFRFDTMSTTLKIYTAVLLVLQPVTSVGLWTTQSWGRVVWFLAIGFQTVAIMRFGEDIVASTWLILFHLAALAIYVVFQLALVFINKER